MGIMLQLVSGVSANLRRFVLWVNKENVYKKKTIIEEQLLGEMRINLMYSRNLMQNGMYK